MKYYVIFPDLTHSSLPTNTDIFDIFANSAQPDETVRNSVISIYTVCHSVINFD